MNENSTLQMVAVKRKVVAWTPIQYIEIVDKIIKYCKQSEFELKIEKDYLTRKLYYGMIKEFGEIKIEPQLLPMNKTMIWRIRVSSYPSQGHFVTPNNSSNQRIFEVADIVLRDYEETLIHRINYEYNLDAGDWERKDRHRRSITYP